MPILASLPRLNLFSSLPSTPPPNDPLAPSTSNSLPIPIPRYPRSQPKRGQDNHVEMPKDTAAFKLPHRKTKYYKPVKGGDVLSLDGDDNRAVVIGESGLSYHLPGAPFEYQFSYSETPKAQPLAIREPAFLPFAPPSMPRPWTGKPPMKKNKEKKKIPLFDSFYPPIPGKKGVKVVEMPGPFPMGKFPSEGKTRDEILGEPLKKWEIMELIKPMIADNRQVNLGRDGLTHNMLNLIHTHWKRSRVCKVRCKGVPTVDMNNVCRVLEEKTGGEIIYRVGGIVYLFRGRNYNHRTSPVYPLMLWKPAAPVYPKLIQDAPEGLTKAEADDLRIKGKKILPICKLAKNGVYVTLVRDVRTAFELGPLVKIDCKGMHASDYKKLGAKLKELVPCVLLSFDDEQILMWRGQSWESRLPKSPLLPTTCFKDSERSAVMPNTKLMSLWKSAIDSNKATLLDDTDVDPDVLLQMVEEFDRSIQAAEHTYQALVVAAEDEAPSGADSGDDDDVLDTDLGAPRGSLPIDLITAKLRERRIRFR